MRKFGARENIVYGIILLHRSVVCNRLSLLLQAYDMTFELNEVEARQEEYPSTLSYLELLNVLIANEEDNSDRGRR